MPSAITISQFRLSFIWFETILSLLGDAIPDATIAPFTFLGRNYTYESQFKAIKQNAGGVPGFTLPWKWLGPNTPRHYFWFYYLNNTDTNNISARLAWEGFVPFRGAGIYNVAADWLSSKGKLLQEAFYYPHGVAFVVSAYCDGNFPLDSAVDLARQIRKSGRFTAANFEGPFSLDELANATLDQLRARGWGDNEGQGTRTSEPFSILTVVKGDGVNEDEAPNEEIQQALDGVTRWQDDYLHSPPLVDLTKASLPFMGQVVGGKVVHPGDVLLGVKDGRAVWFPSHFLSAGKAASLAAYHRNLTLTSLQVESLYGLICASREMMDSDSPFPAVHSECLRRALTYLEQLYGGPMSYHSYSARAQLDMDDELKQTVNEVRAFWNLDPLAALVPVS